MLSRWRYTWQGWHQLVSYPGPSAPGYEARHQLTQHHLHRATAGLPLCKMAVVPADTWRQTQKVLTEHPHHHWEKQSVHIIIIILSKNFNAIHICTIKYLCLNFRWYHVSAVRPHIATWCPSPFTTHSGIGWVKPSALVTVETMVRSKGRWLQMAKSGDKVI